MPPGVLRATRSNPPANRSRSRRATSAHSPSAVTADPSNDRARYLDELRRIAYRYSGAGVTRADVEARLRHNADALTFFARLRRGGMSDADVTAAIFDQLDSDV